MSILQVVFRIILPLVLSFVALFYTVSLFIEPAPKKELTIATNHKDSNYYATALKYQKLLAEQNVKLKIVESSGSVENLDLLNSGKVDIAFVQGGIIEENDNQNLESLASVYYEPLWIFYKNQGYTIEYLVELVSKKISIGANGSGTQYLAIQMLVDNGITTDNTSLSMDTSKDAKVKLLNGSIDAMFLVGSPSSGIIKDLLSDPSVELLNLKRVRAYNQKYKFLSSLVLHEGTIDLYKNLPSENKNLLATTANLVCREGINDELIRIFVKQIKKVHKEQSIFENQNQFPSLENLDTRINKEAKNYITKGDSWLESIFPFWIASQIDRLKLLLIPLLTLLFPLFKGVLPLYRWTIRSKIYKWYRRLDEIEKVATFSDETLKKNQDDLLALKDEVQAQTKVPLSYKGEYYNLLLHIDLVHKELKLQKKD
ncbi:MAG: TRAP transporter TAXI family solute receptor [Sulfurimonas sp.]|jgi:TRAP transporter TAXI family solute receptor|uniref:TAXI family TRAP transporter solute-binding subunit n=1 Tax=Sulfurimonas sp. TaxID=2022749 RepID=UPI0039E55DED